MDQTERIERVSELLDKAASDYDDAAWAWLWSEVCKLAAAGLQASGVVIVRDESDGGRDAPEEWAPLEHKWASTPDEVLEWCRDHGIDVSIGGKAELVTAFDRKPDPEVIAALKGAGFRYVKAGRRWVHKAFGQYERSEKVQAARAEYEAARDALAAGGGS